MAYDSNQYSHLLNLGKEEHIVQFYETDKFLLDMVKEFLIQGDASVTIATKEHLKKLQSSWTGKYSPIKHIFLDAEEILSEFMIDGLPDEKLFVDYMKKIIKPMMQEGKVRVFGEIVALLWEEGNQRGAIGLEKLWNRLQKDLCFSLFCAYPIGIFKEESHVEGFVEVCTDHSWVFPAESYTSLQNTKDRLKTVAILQQKAKLLDSRIAN